MLAFNCGLAPHLNMCCAGCANALAPISARDSALLAGRKLLLADDSITIQKVVDLTFTDEGIQVIAVSNGREAIEKLAEVTPDVVLADVFMPEMNGYQVSEYIKQSEKLKNIPVMLLVGSFEPFDEMEARRVGADDILTKPFQSIRTLIDKVGALLGREAAPEPVEEVPAQPAGATVAREAPEVIEEELVETLKLPKPKMVDAEEETMSAGELMMTTADTKPLSAEMLSNAQGVEAASEEIIDSSDVHEVEAVAEERTMRTLESEVAAPEVLDEVLLDLDYAESASPFVADEILDIDFDSEPSEAIWASGGASAGTAVAVQSPVHARAEDRRDVGWAPATQETVPLEIERQGEGELIEPAAVIEETSLSQPASELAVEAPALQQIPEPAQAQADVIGEEQGAASAEVPAIMASSNRITLDQLAPEVIEAIARRAVEQLSERAVQEIAWEVVPQLAELLIKRQLVEKES
jgi:CheY-like chemotaxis protein